MTPPEVTSTQQARARLVLARHGEAQGNREMRYLGATDEPLTKRGQAQAAQLAQALRTFPLAALYSSPLQRARATADAIASATGLAVTPCDELREQHYGEWEMRTHAEVVALFGADAALWRSDEFAPQGGESLAQLRARMVALADALTWRHPDETIALVCHTGPIKSLVTVALGLPPLGALRLWLDPASVSVVDWRARAAGPSTGLVRLCNSIAHLEPMPCWVGGAPGG